MRAQVLESFNTPYVLRELPLPSLTNEHDLLIRVEAASYCHTDAVLASGQMKSATATFPHVACHEFAGTVVNTFPPHESESTSKHAFKVGDRVGVPGRAFHVCGSCYECMDTGSPDSDAAGYSVYCPHAKNLGLSAAGGFQEYAVVDARQVAPVPEGMSTADVAPLMCAGLTVYAALKKCALQSGARVGIVGCGGGLGHLGLQYAAKMEMRVVGVETSHAALELARRLETGAQLVDATVAGPEDVRRTMGVVDGKAEWGEMGLDAVVILPESQKALDYGIALLRNHGICVVVSFPPEPFHFSAQDLVFRDIRLTGSLFGSNKTLREMLQFSARHNVRAITHRFPFAKVNDLVERYKAGGGGKLIVDMSLG
jgi:D-arabinose 1-dehydrogenase-like Zn-dependent alcohol dehydrogenase